MSETQSLLGNISNNKSNSIHAIFNIINLLVGIGCLSLPYAFSKGGWLISSLIFCSIILVTNHTAKIIANITLLFGYKHFYEMANHIYGKKFTLFIKILVSLELYLASLSYLILIGDNLFKLFPDSNKNLLVSLGFLVTLPTVCIRKIKCLSYLSFFGIITYILLLVNLIYNGFTIDNNPGSVIDPMTTKIFNNSYNLTKIFGLFIVCFGGHAVLPTILLDVNNEASVGKIIDISYIIATILYLSYSVFGYLMYGDTVKEEITLNLPDTIFNNICIGIVVLNPILTTSLILKPLLDLIEDATYQSIIIRIGVYTSVFGLGFIIPNFTTALTIFGCLATYFISIIFPIIIYIKLYKQNMTNLRYYAYLFIIALSIIFSILGLISLFI